MWPFNRRSARREEIRRSRAERELTLIQRLRDEFQAWPVVLTLVGAAVSAAIVNLGGDVVQVQVGQALPYPVTSRVELRLADEQQTRAMQLRARDTAPNWYQLNSSLIEDIRGRLTSLLTLAKAHADDPARLREEATKNQLVLDDAGATELIRIAAASDTTEFQRAVDAAVRTLSLQPLVEYDESAQRRTPVEAMFLDPDSGEERAVPIAKLLLTNTRDHAAVIAEAMAVAFPPALRPSIRGSVEVLLVEERDASRLKPVYRFLSERTAQAAQRAYDRVPVQYLTYAAGAVLADAGVATADERELLKAEQAQYSAQLAADDAAWRSSLLAMLARAGLVFIVGVGLATYIARYQPRAIRRPVRQATTVIVVLFALAVGRLLFSYTGLPNLAVGAQAFAAMLLGLVYSRGLVFAISGALAALMTIAVQQDVGYLIVLLSVSGVLVFSLQEVRTRGKIVLVGATGGLVALLVTLAAGLAERQTLTFAATQGMHAALCTLAAAFLVEGLLPGIERLFSFSTSMTLLEWCDANRPLLRLLAAEAPGTYNHSLLVGALAEKAADAIGANGLLARAGAYYHDIGKTNKPEYFAENQLPNVSHHDRLSPAMSLLIIVGHVKDGIEMAKEYSLPASLRPFIAEHHGTTVVEYFYAVANRVRKPGDAPIADSEFRYPGPKPQSRETAVVMLCDGVEGAVRAMSEPTPSRIEDVVGQLVRKRLTDGQFDECDLTFRDLNTIERSLVKSLCGIYHARVKYPTVATPPGESSSSRLHLGA